MFSYLINTLKSPFPSSNQDQEGTFFQFPSFYFIFPTGGNIFKPHMIQQKTILLLIYKFTQSFGKNSLQRTLSTVTVYPLSKKTLLIIQPFLCSNISQIVIIKILKIIVRYRSISPQPFYCSFIHVIPFSLSTPKSTLKCTLKPVCNLWN